jgi:hypothetical protein
VTSLSVETFAERFFSPPNMAWPDPNRVDIPRALRPFLPALETRGDCPAILPRRVADTTQPTAVYVVCWDIGHAGRVRALLEAAVAHHWCRFDGRVARLDPDDPIDAAVLDFVGPGTTFILRPAPETAAKTFTALRRLVSTIGDTPLRETQIPRPIGRMLLEFDLALAAGAVESSGGLLKEIEAYGGISHENVAFLQLRRLARLGKDQELLAHGSLGSLVYAEPPLLVREGVLSAWARVNVLHPILAEDVDAGLVAIQSARPDVAMLVDASLAHSTDPYVITTCALVAIIRDDPPLTEALLSSSVIAEPLLARLLAAPSGPVATVSSAVSIDELERPAEAPIARVPLVKSWLDWVENIRGQEVKSLQAGEALDWAPLWEVDAELADEIDSIPDVATDSLLAGVAAFLDSDDLDRPAPHAAAALLRRYLIAERFHPYDLGAISALLGIFLRGSPSTESYGEVLRDVSAFAPQWVSVGTAPRAIDLADVVACGPVSASAARSDFVATLLGPLNRQKLRLPASLCQLAKLITDDVGLDFDWTPAEPVHDAPTDSVSAPPNHRILLYSLDTGALARVGKVVALQWPHIRVSLSSDKEGNPALKEHVRNADLIVVATRRATHAATGFITDNAARALVRYPDGSGSASMLRTVEAGIAELVG